MLDSVLRPEACVPRPIAYVHVDKSTYYVLSYVCIGILTSEIGNLVRGTRADTRADIERGSNNVVAPFSNIRRPVRTRAGTGMQIVECMQGISVEHLGEQRASAVHSVDVYPARSVGVEKS